MERAKTRLERGLPAQPPKKKAKKKIVRHDGYDPNAVEKRGFMKTGEWINGAPCPIEGCGLPIYSKCKPENVQPCPLGRGCDTIPRRFV